MTRTTTQRKVDLEEVKDEEKTIHVKSGIQGDEAQVTVYEPK